MHAPTLRTIKTIEQRGNSCKSISARGQHKSGGKEKKRKVSREGRSEGATSTRKCERARVESRAPWCVWQGWGGGGWQGTALGG